MSYGRTGDDKIKKDQVVILKVPEREMNSYSFQQIRDLPTRIRQGKFIVRRRQSSRYGHRMVYLDLHPENELLNEEGNPVRLGWWTGVKAKHVIRIEAPIYKLKEELQEETQ